MNRIPACTFLLLAGTATLFTGQVNAQARGPTVAEIQGPKLDPAIAGPLMRAELEAWLGRLVGQFERTGLGSTPPPPRGSPPAMACVGIGAGPGVDCVGLLAPGGSGISLYGLDPDALKIRDLSVDGRSIAQALEGRLVNYRVIFSGSCPVSLDASAGTMKFSCIQVVSLYALPDSEYVQINIYTAEQTLRQERLTLAPGGRRSRVGSTFSDYTFRVRLRRTPEGGTSPLPAAPPAPAPRPPPRGHP